LHFFLLGINVKRECPAFDHVAIERINCNMVKCGTLSLYIYA